MIWREVLVNGRGATALRVGLQTVWTRVMVLADTDWCSAVPVRV